MNRWAIAAFRWPIPMACLAAAVLWLASPAPLVAQDPFAPSGGIGGAAADPFATPAAPSGPATSDPFGAAPAPTTTKPAATAPSAPSPLATQVLDRNPQSVDELMRAVSDLANMNEADLVGTMVKKLESNNLTDDQLANLEERWGAGLFMKLAIASEYAAHSRQFSRSVLKAAKARRTALPRLDQFFHDLISDDAAKRSTALKELRSARETIYLPLVSHLGKDMSEEQSERLTAAVATLGGLTHPALLGTLDAPKEQLAIRAMQVLAIGGEREALPMMLEHAHSAASSDAMRAGAQRALTRFVGGVPTQQESAKFLKGQIETYRSKAGFGRGDLGGQVTEWIWDPRSNALVSRTLLVRDASLLRQERIAKALYAVAPDSGPNLRRRIATGLAGAKVRGGFDQPVSETETTELCRRAGADTLVATLVEARSENQILAAMGAAEMLGILGDASVLHHVGKPSALCDAMSDVSPRVRGAALRSVMQLADDQPFWGASVVMERLNQAVQANGSPRVLIGHPDETIGQSWAGLLTENSVEADVVVSGKLLAKQAPLHADYDVVFISSRLKSPAISETIQRLREHPAAKNLPIGILCKTEDLFRCKELAFTIDRCEAYPEPYAGPRAYQIYRRLVDGGRFPPISPLLRQQYSNQALGWLAKVSLSPKYKYFEMDDIQPAVQHSLLNPVTSREASVVLGRIGNMEAQQALLNLASMATLPMEMRQPAVAAFETAVKRRGLKLYSKAVKQQYDRYNQTEFQPVENQQLLGKVLDIIEGATPRSALQSK